LLDLTRPHVHVELIHDRLLRPADHLVKERVRLPALNHVVQCAFGVVDGLRTTQGAILHHANAEVLSRVQFREPLTLIGLEWPIAVIHRHFRVAISERLELGRNHRGCGGLAATATAATIDHAPRFDASAGFAEGLTHCIQLLSTGHVGTSRIV